MKRAAFLGLALLAATVVALPLASHAREMGKAKGAMSEYLVVAPHTPEQCAKALDDTQKSGALSKWEFGCMDNDHTGYLMVHAASADDAMKNVPEDERATAKAIKLHKFTAAELKSIHEHMAEAK